MQPPDSAARWLRELRAHPTRHDLLAAFDLLAKTAHHRDCDRNDLSEETAVRFTHTAGFALPLAELLAVTVDPTDPTRHLVTTAAGPLGPASPLPLALADDLTTPAAHALLDRFHHRRTLLLCRGLLAADLPANLDGGDPWSRRICALVGLASAAIDRPTALRLAPLFAVRERSPRALAVAVRRLLPELSATTLRVEPLEARWTDLARDHQTRLGTSTARLGDGAALGERVRLPGTAARLILGPLPASALPSLRPGGDAHVRLCALLGAFLPEPLALELVVELIDLSLPPAHLGQRTLGRDLWLTTASTNKQPRRLTIALTLTPE